MSTPSSRRRTRAVAPTAVAAALVGALLIPVPAMAAPGLDADDVLAATTAAERAALASAIELTAPAEVRVADGVDLASADPQSLIVVLRQPVAATARKLAAASGEELTQADADGAVAASQARFEKFANGKGIGAGGMKKFSSAVNAVALSATGAEITTLLDSPDVAAVWPNETIQVELPPVAADAPADAEPGTLTGGGTTYDEVAALHQEGTTGAGIKVGVLDTGIDYNHPALAAVYAGGYDAVDDDADPMETTYADWKACGCAEKVSGSTYYTSHGTHVAGIIAGQDEYGGRAAWGVAPDVDLYAYRVLGVYGSGSTDNIIEGMEHALADGMDVVNMSLGGSYNDHLSPLSIAADNLTLAGVTTVIAAGNDGEGGAQTLGSPGTSALALTVGANDSPLTLATTEATVGDASAELRLIAQKRADSSVTDLAGKSYPLVDVGAGNPAGYLGKKVEGAIVLIQRGTTLFTDMATTAALRKAAGAIVVNNREEGPIDVFLGESDTFVPMFGVDAADGAAVRAAMAAGATTVSFGTFGSITTDADKLAGFSSRGPANGTTDIKPEVTAPGVSVMSSVPTWDVSTTTAIPYSEAYGRKSGTSMATPFVTGLVALMMQADPTLTPADVKTRLMNTADDLRDETGVFESGAGQVDPRQAVHGTVDAQVIDELWTAEHNGRSDVVEDVTGALSLGMLPSTAASTVTRTVELTNRGAKSATYTLALDTAHGAGTADFAASGATVSFDKTVKVSAGSTKKVKVTLSVPAGAADGTYGAFVTVALPGDEEALRLPLGYRVDDAEITDFTMLKPVMSTGTDVWDPALKFSAGVATPTRTLDLFLVDPETGDDVGYLGGTDATLMKDGLRYGPFAWYGQYLPVTGDKKQPISHRLVTIAEGHHVLKLVATDDSGTRVSSTRDFYVDSTAPVFITNLDATPVHEFTTGQKTFPLSGTLVDGETEAIRAAGIDIDQSANTIYFFSTFIAPTMSIHSAADGSFGYDVALLPSPVQSHRFLGVDAAGNIGGRTETMWFNSNQSYVVGSASTREARVGEQVSMSFVTNNATKFGTMTLQAYFNPRDTTFVGAVAQEAFAPYGRISGDVKVQQVNASSTRIDVPITFDGGTEYTGDGLPLIDLVFEVPETVASATTGFGTVSTFVKRTDGVGVSMQRAFDTVFAIPAKSTVSGTLYAQGLLTAAGGRDADLDHSTIGAGATLTAPDGSVVDMPVQADAAFAAGGLALFDDPWSLEVTLPGHFTWYESLDLTTTASDGALAGTLATIAPALAGGDVNGDDVIDILDAIAVRDAKGTADRAADIDFSGTVDAADLAFVESNFLARNPTAETVPVPQQKYKGTTLDEVLAAFAG